MQINATMRVNPPINNDWSKGNLHKCKHCGAHLMGRYKVVQGLPRYWAECRTPNCSMYKVELEGVRSIERIWTRASTSA
jgi:hypothetical protein